MVCSKGPTLAHYRKWLRTKLQLSQSKFAAKFGFQTATLKNWEQPRTRPDGPPRVLLAMIARHLRSCRTVEHTLRKAR